MEYTYYQLDGSSVVDGIAAGRTYMTANDLAIGLIGAGANTRLRHIPGFQAIEGIHVAAVCNRSLESGQQVAAEFGVPRVEVDPEALLGDPTIDAICIGTWPYRHREYAVRALEAGKHVLCEARMAMDAAEAHAMLAASEARPDLVAQLVPAPFDLQSWRTIRRILADGALGDLVEVHVTALTGSALDPATPLHWRDRAEYSGMNTMQLGIYAEMLQRWLGPMEHVLADASTLVRTRVDAETGRAVEVTVPDSVGVLARMAGGVRVIYRVSNVAAGSREPNGVALHGTRGTLQWSPGDTLAFTSAGGVLATVPPDPGTAGEWSVERDFVASIRDGAPVTLTSFADGLRYMQFTEAVWRSWHERREIEVASL
jgi:predicted dehydrogenase